MTTDNLHIFDLSIGGDDHLNLDGTAQTPFSSELRVYRSWLRNDLAALLGV
jgi:hypothetical protein